MKFCFAIVAALELSQLQRAGNVIQPTYESKNDVVVGILKQMLDESTDKVASIEKKRDDTNTAMKKMAQEQVDPAQRDSIIDERIRQESAANDEIDKINAFIESMHSALDTLTYGKWSKEQGEAGAEAAA